MDNLILYITGAVVFIFFSGVRIIRPTQRGLIERLGKYRKFGNPGFHWIIPIIDRMFLVNITEQMVDAEPQEIITNDNLNASVDAVVYFKVMKVIIYSIKSFDRSYLIKANKMNHELT